MRHLSMRHLGWEPKTGGGGDDDARAHAPGPRRALRRAVEIPCEVVSRYLDEPLLYWATDLSPHGIWLETGLPMQLGEVAVVAFRPMVWWPGRELMVFARVVRAVRARHDALGGMGLEFIDLDGNETRALSAWLRGRPPPLPRRRARTKGSWRALPAPRRGLAAAA
jgi:hypothetical protein